MIVLDLCGGTGSWSKPYRAAGYDVRIVTWPEDVRDYVPPAKVTGILAAPPCTEFSLAKNGQDRDFIASLSVADACLRLVWRCRPEFWALENPRGLLSRWYGPPVMEFEPHHYGDPWTKRTCLWGEFNPPERNEVQPVAGIMDFAHNAEDRARTPAGFARAFFEANNPARSTYLFEELAGLDVTRCAHCGEPLPATRRRDTKFCRNACRQISHRTRNQLREIQPE